MTVPLVIVKKVPPSMTLPIVKKTAIQLAESGVSRDRGDEHADSAAGRGENEGQRQYLDE